MHQGSQVISEPFLKLFLCVKDTAFSSCRIRIKLIRIRMRIKQILKIPSQTSEENKSGKQGKVIEI